MVNALAEALRLPSQQRRRLWTLADHEPDPPAARVADLPVRSAPTLERALDALEHLPALIVGDDLDVIRTNARWRGLHAGFSHQENLAAMVFLDSHAPDFYLDWHHAADAAVAHLRTGSRGSGRRVRELEAASPSFARRWRRAHAAPFVPGPTRFRVRHPALGTFDLRYDVYVGLGSSDHCLHVMFPMNPQSAALVAILDLYAPADTQQVRIGYRASGA